MKLISKTMKQTFENMDKLKSELFDAIDTICKDYETKQEPEFKIGQWVIGKNDYYPTEPERIREIEGCQYKPELWTKRLKDESYDFPWNSFEYIRPATEEEIESHLKKICDEKYIGKRVKSLHDENYIQKALSFWVYSFNEDRLWYEIKSERQVSTNLLIYEQGKFAEIIPDKKKKPETREEFLIFLDDYCESDDKSHQTFLDQYDI